jgi:plastocyanin
MPDDSAMVRRGVIVCILALAAIASPRAASAAEWHARVGAQSHDKGRQALAFLPNEIWIHQGDSITWTFTADEIHTVTFLVANQVRPGFNPPPCPVGNPASFDGSSCVTTPPMVTGDTYTVFFTAAGNFKLVCLVHANMTGVVHVLANGTPLPHDQAYYDAQGAREQHALLDDMDHRGHGAAVEGAGPAADAIRPHVGHTVTAGIGEISATPGGTDTLSVNRFIHDDIVIRAGETVEFDNRDPVTPHTVTFGPEPPPPLFGPPSANVTTDPDGARHITLNSPADVAHSGFIVASLQDQTGKPQTPIGVTRLRVTFTHAGTYPYICVLHDDLGMVGRVVVIP